MATNSRKDGRRKNIKYESEQPGQKHTAQKVKLQPEYDSADPRLGKPPEQEGSRSNGYSL